MLHGGTAGYGARNWHILDRSQDIVTLGLTDPDGTMGFPGTVKATCIQSGRGSGSSWTSPPPPTNRHW